MEWLKDWIVWVWRYIQGQLVTLVENVFQFVKDNMPVGWDGFDFYKELGWYYHVINSWVPLTEVIGLWGILQTLKITMVVWRIIKTFTPCLAT